MGITVGIKGEASSLVEREDTAREVGSGDLLVYATPCMAALMEGAACNALAPALDDAHTTFPCAWSTSARRPWAWRFARKRRSLPWRGIP